MCTRRFRWHGMCNTCSERGAWGVKNGTQRYTKPDMVCASWARRQMITEFMQSSSTCSELERLNMGSFCYRSMSPSVSPDRRSQRGVLCKSSLVSRSSRRLPSRRRAHCVCLGASLSLSFWGCLSVESWPSAAAVGGPPPLAGASQSIGPLARRWAPRRSPGVRVGSGWQPTQQEPPSSVFPAMRPPVGPKRTNLQNPAIHEWCGARCSVKTWGTCSQHGPAPEGAAALRPPRPPRAGGAARRPAGAAAPAVGADGSPDAPEPRRGGAEARAAALCRRGQPPPADHRGAPPLVCVLFLVSVCHVSAHHWFCLRSG